MASKKINITINEELLARLDTYTRSNGMSRSGFLAFAVSQYLNSVEATPALTKIIASVAAVADGTIKGEISQSEAEIRMQAIQDTYASLTSGK